MISGSTEVQSTSLQLGRLSIMAPFSVDLHQEGDNWIALLEPGDLACYEYGHGITEAAALDDLANTVWAVRQQLLATPDGQLGGELLRYKQALAKYTQVNSTIGIV